MDAQTGAVMDEAQPLVFCRVCHDDDHPSSFVVPCRCSGSMQYAHHQCIQNWINEKGDKICEVCCCAYSGSYDDPPLHNKRRQDIPDILDLDSLRELGLEDEHMQPCRVWPVCCVIVFLVAIFIVQLLTRAIGWPGNGAADADAQTGKADVPGTALPDIEIEIADGIVHSLFSAMSGLVSSSLLWLVRFLLMSLPCYGLLQVLPPLSIWFRKMLRTHGLLPGRQNGEQRQAPQQLPNVIAWHPDARRLLY